MNYQFYDSWYIDGSHLGEVGRGGGGFGCARKHQCNNLTSRALLSVDIKGWLNKSKSCSCCRSAHLYNFITFFNCSKVRIYSILFVYKIPSHTSVLIVIENLINQSRVI